MSGPVWECYQCYFLPSSLTAPCHVTCSTLGTMVRCRAWNWIHPALSPDIVNIPGILAMIIHTLAIQEQVDSHFILRLICWNREHGMYPILFKKIRCFQLSHLKPLCDDDEKHMITDNRKLALSMLPHQMMTNDKCASVGWRSGIWVHHIIDTPPSSGDCR